MVANSQDIHILLPGDVIGLCLGQGTVLSLILFIVDLALVIANHSSSIFTNRLNNVP